MTQETLYRITADDGKMIIDNENNIVGTSIIVTAEQMNDYRDLSLDDIADLRIDKQVAVENALLSYRESMPTTTPEGTPSIVLNLRFPMKVYEGAYYNIGETLYRCTRSGNVVERTMEQYMTEVNLDDFGEEQNN